MPFWFQVRGLGEPFWLQVEGLGGLWGLGGEYKCRKILVCTQVWTTASATGLAAQRLGSILDERSMLVMQRAIMYLAR